MGLVDYGGKLSVTTNVSYYTNPGTGFLGLAFKDVEASLGVAPSNNIEPLVLVANDVA